MIGHQGASHLAELLIWGDLKLTMLLASGCSLGDEGIIAVAEALKRNTSLKVLELRNNEATDVAATSLAGAIRENNILESLYLGNDPWTRLERRNQITNVGTRTLVDAMVVEGGLLKVRLEGNEVSELMKERAR